MIPSADAVNMSHLGLLVQVQQKKTNFFFYEPWTVSHDLNILNPAKYQPKIIPPFEKDDL